MNESLIQNYSRLAGFLRALSLRLRLFSFLEFLFPLASGFILAILGSRSVLEMQDPFSYLPFLYSMGALSFLGFLLVRGLRRVLAGPSLERVARGLEEKFPHLKDDVTNSLLLFRQAGEEPSPGQISPGLIAAQVRKTAEEVCALHPQQVVNLKPVLRHFRLFLPLSAVLSIVLALDPPFLNRSLALMIDPLSALPLRETFISVEPGDSVTLRGSPLTIKARATGRIPERLSLAILPEGREALHLPMHSEGGGNFTHRLPQTQFSFAYRAYEGRAASPTHAIRVVDPPEIKKLQSSLIPPDYSRLPKEVKEGGHLEALKGTLVNLEGVTTQGVVAAEMTLNQEPPLPMEMKGNLLKGSLLVLSPGVYSLRVRDEFGFENPNPVQYQIRVIPDKFPEVEILNPAQDLDISGGEEIPLVYAARDDFGISRVRLIWQLGGKESFINLKSPEGERYLPPQSFRWDLRNLALAGGEKVTYRLGVWDNDSVSGPKVAYSRTFTLSVRDERAKAAREGEEAQRMAEAFLDLLADQLEGTKDREALARKMEEILRRADRNLEGRRPGEENPDLEALRRNLASLLERMPAESKETITQEMERLALLAEDLAQRARMEELEALAREIKNRQRRLIDSLKEQKGPLSQERLDALMKELKKLAELLRSVMEALGKMATQLPDEFINSPELSSLNFQDLFQDLEEIQKRLMAGDLAGALEAAQKLLQSLSQMMAAMGRAQSQASSSAFDRLRGEASRQAGELEKIMTEQREILKETEKIDRELREKVLKETENRVKSAQPQLKKALEGLQGYLPPEQKEGMREMERLLKEGKLKRFSDRVREWDRELAEGGDGKDLLEELKKMIEDLVPGAQEVMDPDQKGKFPPLSSRQEKLRERTRDLKEKLEMMAQLFPGMDTEVLKDLQEAAGSMGEASSKLRAEDAPGAIPPEQEVLRRLSRSQQAMRQMAQQMAMRMQASRWGRPLAYDPRAGWYYGPWAPMPTLPQPEVKRPLERGYTGIDREEFDPPSKDAYQVPKIFREKVQEALKEEVPSTYKKDVERYFRGLSE